MLTDSKIKSYFRKPREKQLAIADRDGLSIRVSKAGGVSFFIRYRYAGKADQLTIGTYPEMTLKEARDKNLAYRAMLIDGKNPKIEKRLMFEQESTSMSLNGLISLWYEKEAKERKKNHKAVYAAIKNHVLSRIGDLPFAKITTHHYFDVLEEVKKDAPYQVQSMISNIRQAYAFAIRRRIAESNPLIGISAGVDFNVNPNEVERCLDNDEIRRLLMYIEGTRKRNPKKSALLYLALLYGCRFGELARADIEHLDFFNKVWTVPPENHKTGRKTKKSLYRPIIDEAKECFELLIGISADGKSLVTSSKTSEKTLSVFWGSWPKYVNSWLSKNGYDTIEPWTIHALRKTQRTNMSTIAEPHICEIMLGHKLPGSWRIYDKYTYLEEQKKAYSQWANRLSRIALNSDEIVRLHSVGE